MKNYSSLLTAAHCCSPWLISGYKSGYTGDTGVSDPLQRLTHIPYRYIVEDPTSDEAMCGRSTLWLANAVVQWTLNRTDVCIYLGGPEIFMFLRVMIIHAKAFIEQGMSVIIMPDNVIAINTYIHCPNQWDEY